MSPIIEEEVQKYLKNRAEAMSRLGLNENQKIYDKEKELEYIIELKNSDKFRRLVRELPIQSLIIFAFIIVMVNSFILSLVSTVTAIGISVIVASILAYIHYSFFKNKIKKIMNRYIELIEEYAQEYQQQQQTQTI
jgi:hypothetical protein